MNVNVLGDVPRPPLQLFQLILGVDRAFYLGHEFRERTDIHSDCLSAGSARLNKGRPAADVRVQHEVTGFREGLDGSPREHWREPSRVLVKSVRQTTNGLLSARRFDKPLLSARRKLQSR